MDSSSLQSSSGGDDDYTSHAAPNSLLPSPPFFDPLPTFFIDPDPKPDFSSIIFDTFSPVPDTNSSSIVVTPPETTTSSQPKNPRKRSRTSRRVPTTVLTTDTSNFRAMVQEFTGIPSPPFTSSPFARARLDLFGAPACTGSGPSDVILRPFAQKYYHNEPPGFVDLRNDSALSFQSLLNQPGIVDQSRLRANTTVSSEGNSDIFG